MLVGEIEQGIPTRGYNAPGRPCSTAMSRASTAAGGELLNETLFLTPGQALDVVVGLVEDDNTESPHFSLGYTTPAAFAAGLALQGAAPRSWKLLSAAPCSTSAAARQRHPVSGLGSMKTGGHVDENAAFLEEESVYVENESSL